MTFGEKLKTMRFEAGLSQGQLAQELGFERKTINNYETGRTLPPFNMLRKVAEYFNVPVDGLVTNQDEIVADAYEKGGRKDARELSELVEQVCGMFSGGSVSDVDRDAAMNAISKVYWMAKEENKKYTPHKYRVERQTT